MLVIEATIRESVTQSNSCVDKSMAIILYQNETSGDDLYGGP